MDFFSTHHVNRTPLQLAGLIALVAALYIAAGLGMAYVAGFSAVSARLDHARWWWLAPSFGAVIVAFCGYYFGYRGVKWVEEGPELDRRALLAVVTAGFGGFLARGGTALDEFAMRAGGAGKRESKVRIGALAGFEHGTLALIVCPAAIAALVAGVEIPRTDFSWPWALIPPPAFVLVIWLAERYRDRLHGRGGWRGRVAMFFDTAHLVFTLITKPRRHGVALLGMALYWGADMFGLWAATTAFGVHMSVLTVIVCVGTGMLFTRRTAPLGGGGLMIVALVPTLWYGGAVPFAAATLGVVAYRFFTLWVPLPGALAAIPKLRELGRTGEGTSGGGTRTSKGEPALQH
ncbi:MAG: hypothetical protein ACM3UX_01105 [Candidatus Woesearchaeota archaeon]